MDEVTIKIQTADNHPLTVTLFQADGANPPVVIIASAMGVRRRFYAKFSRYLSARGLSAVTFDYRGLGDSQIGHPRHSPALTHQWGELDLAAVVDWVTAELDPTQKFFVGHSIGGQLLGLLPDHQQFDALYLVASQSGYVGNWSGREKWMLGALWRVVIPLSTRMFGYFPGRLMGSMADVPAGVAREWAMWGRHPDYILSHRPSVRGRFAAITIPATFVSIADDKLYAPPKAVDVLASWFGSSEKRRLHLEPKDYGEKAIGHFGFFRSKFADSLWSDVAQWFTAAPDHPAPK